MKKQFFLGSLLALTSVINAQTWTSVAGQLTTTGKVGIGTASPLNKLHVETGNANDGIFINQTTSGHATLKFYNNFNSTYSNFGFCASGSGSSEGAGHFMLYDYKSNLYNLFVSGGGTGYAPAGNVGIGTITPDRSKLDVVSTYNSPLSPNAARYTGQFSTSSSAVGTYVGARGSVNNTNSVGSSLSQNYGLVGEANSVTGPDNRTYGVFGLGNGGNANWGGYFEATGGGVQNIGVYGAASGATFNNYAGLFDGNLVVNGNTYINGLAYCTLSAWSSDQKLKKDIKLISNATEKIRMLKPSTYLFKTEEFETMNLPKEKQLGLIAQELEKVYPELVSEVPESITYSDNGKSSKVVPSHKAVNYVGLIPVLIAGIQEQQTQLETQQKQIDEQKALINELLKSKSAMPTGINEIEGANGFKMEQNIPNPFSSETVIKYTLTEQTKAASLVVYDLSGKQVASFPIEKNSSSITITSEKLAAGIYIYSIFADGKIIDSKRMVVTQK